MAVKPPTENPLRARRAEEKEERRQAILDAAEAAIAKLGWEGTNFGEVAKRSRLSRSLVYFYFPTRDDLFHAVCERGLAELEKRFAQAIARKKTGLDQVMELGRAYCEFAKDEPLYFRVVTEMQARPEKDCAETASEHAAHEGGQRCLGYVARALANGLADGSVRKSIGDPRPTAVAVWAFTHGLIQISSQRERMLKDAFGLTASKTMDHGVELLRGSLAAD